MLNMNSTTPAKAAAPAAAEPICHFVPLMPLDHFPLDRMARCYLPLNDREDLLRAFGAAPQFSEINPVSLLSQHPDGLRVILLTESDYYARQAAAYLAALSADARTKTGIHSTSCDEEDEYWQDLDLDGLVEDNEAAIRRQMQNSLTVIHPVLLDPALQHTGSSQAKMQVMASGGAPEVLLEKLSAKAVLVSAASGPVLSPRLLQKLSISRDDIPDLFLSLHPSQVDLDLLEELRFSLGFQIFRVKSSDMAYLRRVFLACTADLNLELAPDLDPDAVISHLQRYRGSRFEETDLDKILTLAIRKGAKQPLKAEDLMIRPYRLQARSWDSLERMVGLASVKQALRRQLAKLILDDRRRQSGVPVTPACRNLAFSGHPGTGKSVTARLAAQILREEGCGTGRFVEAGREQLIGTYLGQTSPMIADLFEQAKGGVLFIDEAGALLSEDGHDSYANEAVNALVRHMEMEPETMVIFATYPEEMQRLRTSNAGLSSRVAQVLHFENYDDEQLWDILNLLAQNEQMTLPTDSRQTCLDFFAALRQRKEANFGNGREARRLFHAAMEELALRTLEDPEAGLELTKADLSLAAERLLEQENRTVSTPIGF